MNQSQQQQHCVCLYWCLRVILPNKRLSLPLSNNCQSDRYNILVIARQRSRRHNFDKSKLQPREIKISNLKNPLRLPCRPITAHQIVIIPLSLPPPSLKISQHHKRLSANIENLTFKNHTIVSFNSFLE